MRRVLITVPERQYDFSPIHEYFRQHGLSSDRQALSHFRADKRIEISLNYDAILAGEEVYSKEVLEAIAGKVKIIARYGIGYDKIDIENATKNGIAIANTPGKMAKQVAELTLLMILALARNLCELNNIIKSGGWKHDLIGSLLEGKTVGLVGFGSIAQKLSEYLQVFRCRILAYDVFFDSEVTSRFNVEKSELAEIAAESDFVSIHVPLNEETRCLIDRSFFERMKPTAFFINTARGKVVHEKDLIEALRGKRIAGAALDVFEQEPTNPHNPLLKMPNVIVSPHAGGLVKESITETALCAAEDIVSVLQGKRPQYLLNPDYK